LVQCEHQQSQAVLDGIVENTYADRTYHDGTNNNNNMFWGYKNPRHAYILPVLLEAFQNHTALLFVARHPYDLCSGRNQQQFRDYAKYFASPRADAFGNTAGAAPSCMEFWYELTNQVVDLMERHAPNGRKARIVRIETLVLGSPPKQTATSQCIADAVGYPYDSQATLDVLSRMKEHQGSYGGQSKATGPRYYMWKESVRDTTPQMHDLASKLGYNLTAYGGSLQERNGWLLPTARSPVVC